MTEPIAEVGTCEGFTLARAAGEIDLSNAAEFAEALIEVVDGASPGLIVDMSSLRYVDSAGVRALFDVIRHLEARRQTVALVLAESSPLKKLIKVTNVHEAIPVCDTAEECASALRLTVRSENE